MHSLPDNEQPYEGTHDDSSASHISGADFLAAQNAYIVTKLWSKFFQVHDEQNKKKSEMSVEHQTHLTVIMRESHQLKKLMSFSGIGVMKILSNLFSPWSPGVRMKISFLHTQIPNWSTIHTVMSGMPANILETQTMMMVMMTLWS